MRETHRGIRPKKRLYAAESPNKIKTESNNADQVTVTISSENEKDCETSKNIDSEDVFKTFNKKGIHIINLNLFLFLIK